jgi:hypothetical protein
MILKQDALNALSGTGVGNWRLKFVNGATGTGGLARAGEILNTAGGALMTAAEALSAAAAKMQFSGGLGFAPGLFSSGSGGGDFLNFLADRQRDYLSRAWCCGAGRIQTFGVRGHLRRRQAISFWRIAGPSRGRGSGHSSTRRRGLAA